MNPVDSLLALRDDAGLPVETNGCPPLQTIVEVLDASPHPWGDADCSGEMTPVDSLKILRFDAGLEVSQEENCPLIGSDVQVVIPQ